MKQLTVRAVVMGSLLGGVLSLTNLSIGLKSGWGFGVAITARKSIDMSEDIYKAMLSRGFRGEFHSFDRFHISVVDAVWAASVLLSGSILVMVERGLFHL